MKKRKKDKKSIGYLIAIGILLVIFIASMVYIFRHNERFDVSSILADSSLDVVYDSISNDNDRIPKINIDSAVISDINAEILSMYENKSDTSYFDYQYNVSKDTLSVLIINSIYVENKEYVNYKSYVIDLINMKELAPDEIIAKFNINESDLAFFIKNKFLNYYADLLDAGYLEGNKCDFDCFIVNCNFQDFMEDNNYYIKEMMIMGI